ncbi:macrosialin-like [Cololabis saira]|uniref:macrosialin-like n=1 Tax=Cololabis saira TaxID=129043 RepID=UPI002AD3FA0A|nr:macrosialin-like [Cololabis saira]
MQRAVVLILTACCFTAVALAKDMTKPPATVVPAVAFVTSNTTTKAPPTTTTKAPPTNTTTTKAPPTNTTTTKAPPTTTTKAPPTNTTTTKAPPTNTTTTKPPPTNTTTTPLPPTNTTTTKPPPTNTTTTKAPTTTTPPSTTPSTSVTRGNYSLTTAKGETCLLAFTVLQIRLATAKANGTFNVQPEKTKVQGGCKETTANLTLVFNEGFITFLFNKSVGDGTVYVDAVSFKLSYPFMRGGDSDFSGSNSSLRLFSAKVGHSYSCRNESVDLGKGLSLDLSQDQMQAFNLTTNKFGSAEPCPADRPDYSVAIGVGVTLLVLIVVVVVAYLLGRRKRADGYQSL